jgi:hypothetical protein
VCFIRSILTGIQYENVASPPIIAIIQKRKGRKDRKFNKIKKQISIG